MSIPYMPFYVGDYLADTGHLRAAEHGAYLLLILHYWSTGGIPFEDDAALARIARMTGHQWHHARPIVMGFFPDGKHRRIDRDLAKVRKISESRSHSGELGNIAKSLKRQEAEDANASDLRTHTKAKAKAKEESKKESTASLRSAVPKKRAIPIPDDYAPNETTRRVNREHGFGDADLAESTEHMAAWARSNGHTKYDWHATHQNWIRSDAKRRDERKIIPIGAAAHARPRPPRDIDIQIELLRQRVANASAWPDSGSDRPGDGQAVEYPLALPRE